VKATACAFVAAVALMLVGLFGVVGMGLAVAPSQAGSGSAPSQEALSDIPAELLPVYQEAAEATCNMAWQVLAAVGKVESDHGRSTAPGVRSGSSRAGAMGPMQFLAGTWAAYGRDGDGDGRADVYKPVDAIWGAANYLCANGASDPARLREAIWAYNHASWYVDQVLDLAARYASAPIVAGDVELATAGGITVAASVAPYLEALLAAAAADGIPLGGSGYRSGEAQAQLRLTNGCPDIHSAPASACRVPTAVPGHSMHERGEAVDFTYGGHAIASRANPGFRWLQANAAHFGFYNLASEPWHWSTNGR
jgi:Transglycosylase SLT domain/D-alanyl-D-alanine carboxypeptidase